MPSFSESLIGDMKRQGEDRNSFHPSSLILHPFLRQRHRHDHACATLRAIGEDDVDVQVMVSRAVNEFKASVGGGAGVEVGREAGAIIADFQPRFAQFDKRKRQFDVALAVLDGVADDLVDENGQRTQQARGQLHILYFRFQTARSQCGLHEGQQPIQRGGHADSIRFLIVFDRSRQQIMHGGEGANVHPKPLPLRQRHTRHILHHLHIHKGADYLQIIFYAVMGFGHCAMQAGIEFLNLLLPLLLFALHPLPFGNIGQNIYRARQSALRFGYGIGGDAQTAPAHIHFHAFAPAALL